MKHLVLIFLISLTVVLFSSSQYPEGKLLTRASSQINKGKLVGKWVSIGHNGKNSMILKEDGSVAFDFGDDGSKELISEYSIKEDTIHFDDKQGVACPNTGIYEVKVNEYYSAFNVIQDDCGGRVKSTMGYWVRPNYEEVLKELTQKIENKHEPENYLIRGRMYLALGKSEKAKADFDYFVEHAKPNARIYVNRASTYFPNDMQGVIADCNKAIELDANEKNAYFLKGLAQYTLGKKEEACQNFTKAIELGFTVLRKAEQQRCAEFWDKQED
jgi:tetratricopeptide (TPR) repeat protein